MGLVPKPLELQVLGGEFRLGAGTTIAFSQAPARQVAEYLAARMRPASGLRLQVVKGASEGDSIQLDLQPELEQDLGSEGYRLESTRSGMLLTAAAPAGLFYGCQTLCQLFPPALDSPSTMPGVDWIAPCVRIEDRPRFEWRGLMLDSGRHFFSVESVKRFIDLLSRHKLNRFHWHLTEDQGWRIEILAHPDLTRVGSKRKQTPILSDRNNGDGQPHSGFYTQADIREVVAYAADRFVTVVPEIELPGHALAALATYPEISCTGGPFEVGTRWGVHEDVYCAGNEETFAFLESVLVEVVELFPGSFLHIGGDECPKARWKACAKCQKRMREHGLQDENELQAYFIERIGRFLKDRNKRLLGWDEILEGRLAPGATVMSWRGVEGGITAANMGHDVVMSPTSHCYFDYYQSEDHEGEPPAIGGHLPLEKVYGFEPIPEQLSEAGARHVLGAQGNVWTEYIPDQAHTEYMTYPRAAALAERVWSTKNTRDFGDFRRRLMRHVERLRALDVNFRALATTD